MNITHPKLWSYDRHPDRAVTGKMPRRALNLIWTWLDKHQAELLENWDRARQRQPLNQIEPLAWGSHVFTCNSRRIFGRLQAKTDFQQWSGGIVDLEKELYGEVFEPLRDKDLFKQVFLTSRTIEWPNGADFAPEFLLEIAKVKAVAYPAQKAT